MSDSPYIFEINSSNFQQQVIESSFNQPVLVDFWAAWCNPCQQLIPVLHKLVDDYQGGFLLCKVNTDEERDLAAQAGVRSLPTVKLFVDGQIVDEFMGALPESDIRNFLDQYIANESDEILSVALQAYNEGNTREAIQMLNEALANDPENDKLKINIAKLVANQNDLESAQALIDSLKPEQKDSEEVKEIQAQIKIAEELKSIGDPNELQQRIQENPEDLDALLKMSTLMTARGDYETAMNMLLTIMQKNREFEDDAGRQGLLNLFELLGNDHPMVKTYRRKMFTLLH